MGVKIYGKLVRDRIPEIIKANGQKGYFRVLEDDEFKAKLNEKLCEELREYLNSKSTDEAVLELADLSEIMDAILKQNGVSREKFEALKQEKRIKHGGFQKKIFLEKVED